MDRGSKMVVIICLVVATACMSAIACAAGEVSSLQSYPMEVSDIVQGKLLERVTLASIQGVDELRVPDGEEVSLLQSYPMEVRDVIEGTLLEKDPPDSNESAEELKVYLRETEKVSKSINKRNFHDEINHGAKSDTEWLEESADILSTSEHLHSESRHIHEALGYVNRELGAYTNRREYIVKAAEEFQRAEELGIEHGRTMYAHYSVVMSQLASQLNNKDILEGYFSMVFKEFPDDEMSLLWYAQALSKMHDEGAEQAFQNALVAAKGNNIDQVISYAEFLLDQGKNEKALEILDELPQSYVSYYAHFLRGLAFENMGIWYEAEREYDEYKKFATIVSQHPEVAAFGNMFFRPPARFNKKSKVQGEKVIRFKEDTGALAITRTAAYGPATYPPEARATSGLCASNDYVCKAIYYAVWIVDGEAMRNGGTIGMGRAVFWNVRARVFNKEGWRTLQGIRDYCYNYAWQFPYATNDDELIIRYFEVMNTGVYAGLNVGNYTSSAEQIAFNVFYGEVPDPTVGLCPPGVWVGDPCTAYCGWATSYWGAFDSTVSCMEFRAGYLKSYTTNNLDRCYNFVPMYTPSGTAAGSACWGRQQLICPRTVTGNQGPTCYSMAQPYYYTGPVYGNFCWSFVR
ncbi:MAG: tetratricopeptide repeat protein [Nitrospiraceae bacterium]|nr:tetratricopeptide repeat protein [Nitrospiraceae bacterium]